MSKGNRRSADLVGTELDSDTKLGDGSDWPTIDSIVRNQQLIEETSRKWLETCRGIAKRRLPEGYFNLIPEDIWRFRVNGSKVVVMRAPEIGQVGAIELPESSKRAREIGWVLTVGPNIHRTSEANVRGREYDPAADNPEENTKWEERAWENFIPLLAVGDLVLINKHAGQALSTSLLDEGTINRSLAQQFLLISIADIFGPMIGVKASDWSSVQEQVMVPVKSRIIV